jgi:hypothetical protein
LSIHVVFVLRRRRLNTSGVYSTQV